MKKEKTIDLKDFDSDDPIAWCPGCGNFSILKALKQAFVELKKNWLQYKEEHGID